MILNHSDLSEAFASDDHKRNPAQVNAARCVSRAVIGDGFGNV